MAITRRVTRARSGALLLAVVLAVPALVAFTGPLSPATRLERTLVSAEDSTSSSSSVALVKVSEENKVATAGVIAGVAGLLVGGVWVGGALFTISSYLARKKDDDVANALKGLAAGGLEALNFVDYLNNKYEVTGKLGSAISDAIDGAKTGESKETVSSITSALKSVTGAIESFDKDVGIKDTLGGIIVAGGELATQALDKAIELNKEYKISDQIVEKINASIGETKK